MRDGFSEASDRLPPESLVRELRGEIDAEAMRIAVVVARFNPEITEALLRAAVDTFLEHGAEPGHIEVVRVPGAWELAPTARRLLDRGRIDAVVALGCVIRGETPHFDFVAGEAARGLGDLARRASIPIVFGVLTTDDLAQARARAGSDSGNKGREAALAAIEMADLFRRLA